MIVVATRQSASPRRNASIVCLQLGLVHLAVGLGEADARAEGAQALGGLVQRVDPVVEEEGLAPARRLALDRAPHQLLVVGPDVGPDRPPALGRRLDHRDVAQPGEAHLQRARNRRRGQREHVDPQLQLAQQLLLAHAEALLLVDDHEPESSARTSRESSRWVPIRMSTFPSANARAPARTSAGLAQARDHLDLEREVGEALAEGAEVLLGEDRRRHQHHHLAALGGRLERRPHRDLGLAVADVAADQPVHRPLGLHVLLHRLDRLELVGRLAVGEARSSFSSHSPSGSKAWPLRARRSA